MGSSLIYYILKLSSTEYMKLSPTLTYETTTYLNIWNPHLFEHMKQMWESLHKIFTSVSTFSNHVTIQSGHLCNSSGQHFNHMTPVSSRNFKIVCTPSSNNVFWKTSITSLHFSHFTIHNIPTQSNLCKSRVHMKGIIILNTGKTSKSHLIKTEWLETREFPYWINHLSYEKITNLPTRTSVH